MNLQVKIINDKFYVVDEDDYSMPFSIINNYSYDRVDLVYNSQRKNVYNLKLYFTWLDKCKIPYNCISENNIIDFRNYYASLQDQRLKSCRLAKVDEGIIPFIPDNDYHKKVDTVSELISSIRGFYNYCIKCKIVLENPCPLEITNTRANSFGLLSHTKKTHIKKDTLKLKDEFSSIENDKKVQRIQPFSSKEIKIIFSLIHHPQEVLLLCLLFLGMRISEARGRRIVDIDWKNLTISIIKREDDPIDVPIKYNSQRIIPIRGILYFDNLPEVMYEAYTEYKNRILIPKKDVNVKNFLFINLQGNVRHIGYKNINNRIMERKLQPAFKGIRDISFHTMRHHMATSEIAMGKSIEEVQKILGHDDISTTIGSYYHPTLRLLSDLYKNKEISKEFAEERTQYLIDYRKLFYKGYK